MNFKKLNLGLVALVLGFGLVVTQSAFTTPKQTTSSFWRYNLDSETGALSGFNYTKITDPEAPGCADEQEIPCVIEVEGNINSQLDLDNYLSTTFGSEVDVMQIAVHTKAEL